MINKTVVVNMKSSSDLKPIAMLVQKASQFQSMIFIEKGTSKVNAKSLMGMMAIGIIQGEELTLSIEGVDEEEALLSMEGFLIGK